MVILISKLDTIINIRNLDLYLDTITLHQVYGNNINKLVSKMMRLFQEIHARTGKESYTNRHFTHPDIQLLELSLYQGKN